ncbi:MAG: hypothetical protein AUJ37_00110 [Candidatus Magasanikbacteria bacterium CG1_02_41_34]|nr:MAG: hypothetical protein AUJ37_00110 [Candidatus Magasanikbacteria bacterium CG1_02_41_34]
MTKQSTFTNTFLDQVKAVLLTEKNKLDTELSKFTKQNPHASDDYDAAFPEYGDEPDENAREVADYTTNKSLEIALEKSLRDVHKSIERIEAGTYGICKYCDKAIDEKRLLARPTSGSCVDCKKALTDEL